MTAPTGKIKDLFGLQRAIADTPAAAGVVGNLHLDDQILHYLLDHPAFPDLGASVGHYFIGGRRCARRLAGLLEELGLHNTPSISILEFASGYGRVTRHLRAALPSASIVACDIHEQAVTFIEQELGVQALHSQTVPEAWRVPRYFDVIFALSFYSHMPRETWSRWIRAHVKALEPRGFLIFTTHGRKSLPHLGWPELAEDGFWYGAQSEQQDLSTADYGQTVVTREFVDRALAEAVGGSVTLYREGYWWEHQDLYVVQRESCAIQHKPLDNVS